MVRRAITAVIMGVCAAVGCGGGDEGEEEQPPTAFGRACYQNVPCQSGLTCADVDGRPNFLCTSRCSSDAECRGRHGVAACTGDGYCAIDCTDTTCPGDLWCVSGGWCGKF
jgi:hypothetical protein